MNTLVLAPFSAECLAALEALGSVAYEPWTQTQTLHDPEELGSRLEADACAALVVEADFLFEELFEAAPHLRFAAICRAALNQVDVDAATAHGVAIVHTPGRNAQAVGELVLALMLSLARGVPQAADYVVSGHWRDPAEPYTHFQGRELASATLGLIGLGGIGKVVAKIARAAGMRVLASDPYVRPGAPGAGGVELIALEELLRRSDFVSLHVPDTDETAGMLGERELALLGPHGYLINVTSPNVVDERALAGAVRSRAIAGAAMDVHEAHPVPPGSTMLALARELPGRVLLTPHIGGTTIETVARHSRMVVDDLRRYTAGTKPKHLANPAVWRRRRR